MNIEFNIWPWVRNLCKYGDFFLKLEIAEKFGVYNVIPYTAFQIERQEGFDPENPTSVRFKFDPEGVCFYLAMVNIDVPGNKAQMVTQYCLITTKWLTLDC